MHKIERKIYCIGEAIYDIIIKNGKPVDGKVGGALLNTAVSLGRSGLPVEYIGDTGDDAIGDMMKSFLENNAVGIKYFNTYKGSRSRLAVAFIDNINAPKYVFYKLDTPIRPKLSYPEINKDDIIVFGSFFGIKKEIRAELLDFLKKAKEQGAFIIYDPNFRVNHLPLLDEVKPYILENMEIAHVTKGSDDDFKLIFGANSIEEVKTILADKFPKIFFYTANKHGIWHAINGEINHYPVKEIAPLSAIGAGDAFNAGLAYSCFKFEITADNYFERISQNMHEIIKIADDFAEDVCQSFDNYVGEEIVEKYGM